jgi:hypothetical protein
MAYYLKPLTNNSVVAGVLLRRYPGRWTVLGTTAAGAAETTTAARSSLSSTKQKSPPPQPRLVVPLGSFTDEEILVPKTNTPDLRPAVRLVQRRS